MSDQTYEGMTVNERLYAAGLLDAFDNATQSGDRSRMIEILKTVQVILAEQVADQILSNPAKYGYIA